MRRLAVLLSFACLAAAGCGEGTDAKASSSAAPPPAAPAAPRTLKDAPAGSHKNGLAAFKDPGVYVDGVPRGMLTFGELPVPLEVAWYEEEAAVPFKAGDPGPRTKLVKQRRYRFRDYLTAIGVDLARVKALHIYGGQRRVVAVSISGDELRAADDFTFRFGAEIGGKPIPACPPGVGDGKCPDIIGVVTVYVDKEPPRREGGHFYLGDERVKDIPYHGPPLRGGIRVYKDNVLVATIKRNALAKSGAAVKGPKGDDRYALFAFLEERGVALGDVSEAWLVHGERRVKRVPKEALLGASFSADAAHQGAILFGDDDTPTQAIALHTRPLKPEDLPVILPEEAQKQL